MLAARMIPALWFRMIVIVGFTIFMGWEKMWWLVLIGFFLVAVTGFQLASAYKSRDSQLSAADEAQGK